MVIQCWLSDVFLHWRNVIGMAPLPFVILIDSSYPPGTAGYDKVVAHERCHQRQMVRLGFVGFYVLYVWQYIRYGYRSMPLELEARDCAEREVAR